MCNNFKKNLFILLIFFVMFLSIASISASDDNNTKFVNVDNNSAELIDNNDNNSVLVDNEKNNSTIVENNDTKSVLSNSNNTSKLEANDKSILNEDSYSIEYDTIKKAYTKYQTTYNVKVYTNVYYNGILYQEPLQGFYIKINVYTGNKFSSYAMTTNSNGIASFKISSLDVGTHKVNIYDKKGLKATSSITFTKTKYTVLTDCAMVSYKKSVNFEIKINDKYNYPIKNFKFKIKVYTGSKYKSYTLKTNSKGIAKFNTKILNLGVHKVVIKSSEKNYYFSKQVKIYVYKYAPSTKVTTKAVTVKYKKESCFNVKVLTNLNKAVKNINLKISTKSYNQHKTLNIKTDEEGIAKLNTKTLAVGTHSVTIKSSSAKYKFIKYSKIIVKKTNSEAPILKELKYYQKGNLYYAKLSWHSEKNVKYQILKNINGKFNVVGSKTAKSNECSFSEKVDKNKKYIYSVREVHGKKYGLYDKKGIMLLGGTNVNVQFKNTRAIITWTKVEGATKYNIYRKLGSGDFKCIAKLDTNRLEYSDYYYKYPSTFSGMIKDKYYIDPTINTISYNVRAIKNTYVNDNKKISYGMMTDEGEFNLVAPTVLSLKNNVISWATVPNAKSYLILEKNSTNWKIVGQCVSSSAASQTFKLSSFDSNSYYSVQAYSVKNNQQIFTNYDKSFTLKYYSENNSNQRILFIGDSVLYGSGNGQYSIPYRVEQMLGCVYYNPSIPGATYHDLGQINGVNIENTKNYRCRIPREVIDKIYEGELPYGTDKYNVATNSIGESKTKLEDYNIIVLAAGTNDYTDYSQLGSIDSNDVSTFNGAINHIFDKIEKASIMRVLRGEKPIKVVFLDLFFSGRTSIGTDVVNRDTTPNKIGLTLTDYQNALNKQFAKWSTRSSYLTCYEFKTRSYNLVNTNNCEYNTKDNLHFTRYYASQYGSEFAKFLYSTVF